MRRPRELKLAYALCALALGLAPPARSQNEATARYFFPATRLIDVCTHDGDPTSITQCVGYLSAVADTEMQRLQFTGKAYFCRPPGFSIGQLKEIVLTYARAHPERSDIGAANLVTFAWQGAFPCPANQASQ
jgi:hypothetical protein